MRNHEQASVLAQLDARQGVSQPTNASGSLGRKEPARVSSVVDVLDGGRTIPADRSMFVQFVLRIVLAVMIVFGGALPNTEAVASASPCEHVVAAVSGGVASDDCHGMPSGHVDHKADHCIVASSGCCAPLQSTSSFKAPLTTTADVDWLVPIDRALRGRSFAPATPPPRI